MTTFPRGFLKMIVSFSALLISDEGGYFGYRTRELYAVQPVPECRPVLYPTRAPEQRRSVPSLQARPPAHCAGFLCRRDRATCSRSIPRAVPALCCAMSTYCRARSQQSRRPSIPGSTSAETGSVTAWLSKSECGYAAGAFIRVREKKEMSSPKMFRKLDSSLR